jgi:hypothetical protein
MDGLRRQLGMSALTRPLGEALAAWPNSRRQRIPFRLRAVPAGWRPIRPTRCARQRVGVGGGLRARQLPRRGNRWFGMDTRGLQSPCPPRRVLGDYPGSLRSALRDGHTPVDRLRWLPDARTNLFTPWRPAASLGTRCRLAPATATFTRPHTYVGQDSEPGCWLCCLQNTPSEGFRAWPKIDASLS